MNDRRYTPIDTLLIHLDQAVCTVFGHPDTTGRPDPATGIAEGPLQPSERLHAARLMRINHTGEICAQALYQGQALTARDNAVRYSLEEAAAEENDHLDWCEGRVKELGSRTSVLNPLFYGASLALGALAGRLGDRWSLGFLAETEHQVVQHLDNHLWRLPAEDHRSRAILQTIKEDEGKHASTALEAGAAPLPLPVRWLMRAASKIMTSTTYWT